MNRQETFNKVATHLLWQYEKCIDTYKDRILPLYRSGNLACAIGCLIPASLINKQNNAASISILLHKDSGTYKDRIKNKLKVLDDDDIEFLSKLQKIHDHVGVDSWSSCLASFAMGHNIFNFRIHKTSTHFGRVMDPETKERFSRFEKELQRLKEFVSEHLSQGHKEVHASNGQEEPVG